MPVRQPGMRPRSGAQLVEMAAGAHDHQVVGDDLLDADATQDAWHTFADLVVDLGNYAGDMRHADREAVAIRLDMAIRDLCGVGVRVVAGVIAGRMLIAAALYGQRVDVRQWLALA